MPHFDVMLFDLDGTLTDSLPGITRSIQFALVQMGIALEDPGQLARYVGPPLAQTFEQAFHLSPADARRALAFYREYFAVTGIFENAVYPGIPELLAELAPSATLILATSKPTVYAERILAHFSLAPYFTAIIGSFLDGRRVEKAEIIHDALCTAPSHTRAVMIGDREHDILGARANGIATIGVNYGYALPGELVAARPDHLATSVEDLRTHLLGMISS